jgi:Bacterial mobilisation protein (MobC).
MAESKRGKLDARIEYRCTISEKERLQSIAKIRTQTLSELITEAIAVMFGEADRLGPRIIERIVFAPEHGLTVAVNRIGNNLNQISHGVNESLASYTCPNWVRVESLLILIHADLYCLLELSKSFAQASELPSSETKNIFEFLVRYPSLTKEILKFMESEESNAR